MANEIQELLESFSTQAQIVDSESATCESNKSSSRRLRKATSEITKIGKALRAATIANEK